MSFRIRELDNEEDWIFFDDLEFKSFLTTVKNPDNCTEQELLQKYKEFDEADPLDPRGFNHKIFIAISDNGIQAGLIWLCNREPFWRFKQQHVWIYNLHVIPYFRKMGLARQLMFKAEKWCLNQGLDRLALHVLDDNTAARHLYESLDYKLVATHNESCFYEKILG